MKLSVKEISKSVDGKKLIDCVSFECESGSIVSLIGSNGSGKSTCFSILGGATQADSGAIYLDNKDITREPIYRRRALGIGYLPQNSSLLDELTAEENVMILLEIEESNARVRKAICKEILDEFGLSHLATSMASSLSGGESRRLEIARCLSLDPRFLCLDEPFVGIDPMSIADLKLRLIGLKQRGIGVVITDHNAKDLFEISDVVYLLNDGKVLDHGTAKEMSSRANARNFYLGQNFQMSSHI